MAAKKIKKNENADVGMAALLKAEQQRLEKEQAELKAKWREYEKKPVIGNDDGVVATVHRIAEVAGVDVLTSQQVKTVGEFVRTGQLWLKDGAVMYSLRRSIKIGDRLQKDFVLQEIPDSDMVELGVDAFRIGILIAQGRRDEIDQNDIRRIARGAISMPEDFAGQLPTRELMAIYGLYTLFFLGL